MTATDDWTVTKPVRTAPAANYCLSRSGMNRPLKNRPVMNRPVMNRPGILWAIKAIFTVYAKLLRCWKMTTTQIRPVY